METQQLIRKLHGATGVLVEQSTRGRSSQPMLKCGLHPEVLDNHCRRCLFSADADFNCAARRCPRRVRIFCVRAFGCAVSGRSAPGEGGGAGRPAASARRVAHKIGRVCGWPSEV
eukprot:364050-Chlamydomonas_euryale.AAC.22